MGLLGFYSLSSSNEGKLRHEWEMLFYNPVNYWVGPVILVRHLPLASNDSFSQEIATLDKTAQASSNF